MLTTTEQDDRRQEPNKINPWNPVAAIFRCWRWALPLGLLLAAITAAAVVYSFVPTYQASCLLAANRDYVLFKNVMPVIQDLAKSDRALLLNPIVLDPVLSEPGIRSAPSLVDPAHAEKNLLANLSVTSGPTDGVMAVSYEDTDPKAAAMVCNSIVASYLRQRNAFENKRISNLEHLLEPEIQRWELEVSEKKRTVEALNKITFGDLVATAQIEGDLEFQRVLRTRIGEVSLEIEIMDAKIAVGESESASESRSKDSDSQLDGERSQAENEIKRKREHLSAELGVLKKRLREEKSKLETLGSTTAELQFAQDELNIANEVLSKLRRRVAEIRTERRQDGAVRLIAPATPPRVPSQPFPVRKVALASFAALLAPFMLGFLFGFVPERDSNRHSKESD